MLFFSLFDVVYINYVPTSQFGGQDAHKLHNWLKTKKNRVLIASYDASDVSQNLLAEILAGKSGIKYFTIKRRDLILWLLLLLVIIILLLTDLFTKKCSCHFEFCITEL